MARVRRIKGQVEGVERAIDSDENCERILQTLASIRGALRGLMGELMESHLMEHALSSNRKSPDQRSREAKEILEIIKVFTK